MTLSLSNVFLCQDLNFCQFHANPCYWSLILRLSSQKFELSEKQQKMTQKEIEAYEKEMQSKNFFEQMWMQVPAAWRFQEGFKKVIESIIENPVGMGIKPGLD